MARAMIPEPPIDFALDIREQVRKVAQAVRSLLHGKGNFAGEVTLTASATTTTVRDARITADTVVVLSPRTAKAASVLSTTWLETKTGQVVIHHGSDPAGDQSFGYALLG